MTSELALLSNLPRSAEKMKTLKRSYSPVGGGYKQREERRRRTEEANMEQSHLAKYLAPMSMMKFLGYFQKVFEGLRHLCL